jgi:hypothetical protein
VEAEVAARGAVRGATPRGAGSGELGMSSSVAAHHALVPARWGVPIGGTIGVSSISKKIKIVSWMGRGSEGKNCLIKHHVSGDHKAISG